MIIMLLKKNISCPFLCGSSSAHQNVFEPATYNPLGLKNGQFNFNKKCDLTKLNFFLNASIKDHKKDSYYVYELPDVLKHNKISEVLKFIENCTLDRQTSFSISVEAMAEFIFYSKMQEDIAKQLSKYWDDINHIYDLRINVQLDSKTISVELLKYKTFINSLEYKFILDEMGLHPFQVRFLDSSQIETLFEDFSSKFVSTLFESLNRDDGKLTKIDLSNKSLSTGHFCSILKKIIDSGDAETITSLNLQKNKISILPQKIFYLKSLVNLNLCDNELCDLPETLFKLNFLECINIGKNFLWSLSNKLQYLTSLENIYVEDNMTQFEMPSCLDQMVNLKVHSIKK